MMKADEYLIRSRLFRRLRCGPYIQLVELYAARLVKDGLARQTAKLNDIDLKARLVDVRKRIAESPIQELEQLLSWHWKTEQQKKAAWSSGSPEGNENIVSA